jgi:hypothetical protein
VGTVVALLLVVVLLFGFDHALLFTRVAYVFV